MTKNKVVSACVLLATTLLVSFVAYAQSASPQEILTQYIADLQKAPNDNALREKIIKHVQTMKKPPAIPEEARRHYVKAITFLEDAKQPSDSSDAAEEFRQALLIAPWWGDVYMKMGLALETAERYDDAIASLRLFMATKPQDDVLRKTQDEIYKIEAKREKAAKDSEQARKDKIEMEQRQRAAQVEEEARAQQRKAESLYSKCDGKRNVRHWDEPIDRQSVDETADFRGNRIILGTIYHTGRNIPSNVQLGVWQEYWILGIAKKEMQGGRLVLFFDNSNNNWMYEKAYLTEDCEIKFTFKHGSETDYYLPAR